MHVPLPVSLVSVSQSSLLAYGKEGDGETGGGSAVFHLLDLSALLKSIFSGKIVGDSKGSI